MVVEWENLFFIDIEILNKMALWLCGQQNVATGSWGEVDRWYDRKMLDPVSDTPWEFSTTHNNMRLTAPVCSWALSLNC